MMGRGNFSYEDGYEIYIDPDTTKIVDELKNEWDEQKEGRMFDYDSHYETYDNIFFEDLKVNIASAAGDSFSEIDEGNDVVRFFLESDLLKIGIADNDTSIAVIFEPRKTVREEFDKRSIRQIERIVNNLMKYYDVRVRTSAWTSGKVEGKFAI